MSLGNAISITAGPEKGECWKHGLGYSDDETKIIIRHQILCVVEMKIGLLGGVLLLSWLFIPPP